jgi:hypothetical protein
LLSYKPLIEEPRRGGVLHIGISDKVLLRRNVARLQALGTSFYIKRDRLAFVQGFETRALDRVEVYEYIIATAVLRNKTKTLGFVEPFYSTCSHITFTF